jgi:hypothetical protein
VSDADIGVFGGSGFYSFVDDLEERVVSSAYGDPSDRVTIGTIGAHRVAFLPRHGRKHHLPPHRVNYRANVAVMHDLGVRLLLAPFAAGSLQPTIHPGDFRTTPTRVVCSSTSPNGSASPCTTVARSSSCKGHGSRPAPSPPGTAAQGGTSST